MTSRLFFLTKRRFNGQLTSG